MKNIWKKIKEYFRSELDRLIDTESVFISANKTIAENLLKELGWNILSTDDRVCFFGYKIQKGDKIYKVSLREVLKLK